MQALHQSVDQVRRARDDLRAAGLDTNEQNVHWWLRLPVRDRRLWRGEEIEIGQDE